MWYDIVEFKKKKKKIYVLNLFEKIILESLRLQSSVLITFQGSGFWTK